MISIIIPVINEADTIGRCLDRFQNRTAPHEIVVVDGGSRDGTAEIVQSRPNIKWVSASGAGRGRQMDFGARFAVGDILLFLHADTLLPREGLSMIAATAATPGVVAGAFSLRFDAENPFLRAYARLSRWNHILFTYGDQGLFVTRRVFEQVGGFGDVPLMEDVAIQKRLRKAGRFVKIRHPVVTSARRFLTNGVIRQQLLNTVLVLLYHAGVSAERLSRFYRMRMTFRKSNAGRLHREGSSAHAHTP